MKKRVLSLLLALSMMIGYVLPAGGVTVFAAEGTSSTGLAAASTAKADVDKIKFTHLEWTGTDYTDVDGNEVTGEDVFGINREDASVPRIPYQDAASAVASVWDYNARENSTYFDLLTGEDEEWQLAVYMNESDAQAAGVLDFYKTDYDMDAAPKYEGDGTVGVNPDAYYGGFQEVTLPMSWTMQGFDYPIYTNTNYPADTASDPSVTVPNAAINFNPVGLYRHTFEVSNEMRADNRRIYLSFQGVESAYYVYLNGKEVGYSEDTFAPHRFDITDYLVDGENLLAVKVHRFCDGTWFEDQDMIYDGGIFRDVYITSEPLVKIEDYTVVTDLDENYENATLKISADVRNLSSTDHSGWSIQVKALDENGNDIAGGATIPVTAVASTETGTFALDIPVTAPKLWSAEDPNLYALVLTLVDGEGKEVESLSTQLGFRELTFTSTEVDESYAVTTTTWETVKINGQRLLLKGVNRTDTDSVYGKAVPQETMLEDVKLMKQFNLNAVRTSHYSNDEYFYWLCNKYGLYMMAETNLEAHKLRGYSNASEVIGLFYELCMDRTQTSFERLKNNPAIVMWSIMNETANTSVKYEFGNGVLVDMIWYFKNNDPTRMVHSEGQKWGLGVDMDSNMYPSYSYVQSKVGAGKMPYVLCEYDHAMGNSVGGLEAYWDIIRSADNMLGGFIWDWKDQSRPVDLTELGAEYTIADRTGVTGQTNLSVDQWNTDAGEGSLNGGTSFSGYTLFDDEKYNEALSGTGKSFTFEVIVKPTTDTQASVLLSKGDTQVALKTRGADQKLEFFVYDSGSWKAVRCSFPDDWVGNWHQVVGVYDKGAMSIYVDNVLMVEGTVTDSIASSSNELGVGFDVVNQRALVGEISIARIYTKALTADEIQAQNSADPAITSDDESVLLWLDYSDEHTALESQWWDYYSEEFVRQGLYTDLMEGKFYAYGGDWGETNHANNFCQNGLLSADLTPQPEIYEVKYQYQNYWFSADLRDLANGEVTVFNESGFTNLNAYNVIWEVMENGQVVESGTVENVDIAPGETGTISVPFTFPMAVEDGSEYYLNLSVRTKEATDLVPADHEVAWEQLAIPVEVAQARAEISDKAVTVTETDSAYNVAGENFSFSIRKADGILENYVFEGETLMIEGPAPNFWFGATDNHQKYSSNGIDADWEGVEKNISVQSIEVSTNEDGQNVITADIIFPDAGNTAETIIYTINGTGEITVDMTVDATSSGMGGFLRVGSSATLPAGFEQVTWYGNGPVETFSDRKTGARQGIWETTASGFFYPYESVDESVLTDVVWMKVTNEELDNALVVAARDFVEASALHFTSDDLFQADHPYELTPRDETILNINYGTCGTGSATVSIGALAEYQLPSSVVYNWNFTLMPVAADADEEAVYEAVSGYHTVESYDLDNIYIDDTSANNLDTLRPDTAELVSGEVENTRALKGYFALNDPEMTITKAMTQGNAFTVAVRVYTPVESVTKPSSGSSYNMIASLGDKTFGLRTRNAYIDAFICNGSKWNQISSAALDAATFGDQWHDIVVTYSGTTLTLIVDGEIAAQETAATASINNSGNVFYVGYDPTKGRYNNGLLFDQVVVYNEALTVEQLAEPHLPADENVILWMDYDIYPDTLELSESELVMYSGEEMELVASITPEDAAKTMFWTSSDESAATVENGVVTAVAEGEAVITVTTINSLTAECAVTVKKGPADVIALIDAIGEVTTESGDAIDEARAAYDELPDRLRDDVTNYQALLDAEHEYAVLVSGENADAAEEAARLAAEAQAAAETARNEALAAKAEAEAAQAEAEAAEAAAIAARDEALKAQAAAEEAAANAGLDAQAAENAKLAALAAQEQAEEAEGKAEQAKLDALAAQSAAETAEDNAIAAETEAKNAAQAAEESNLEAAEQALKAADEAAKAAAEYAKAAEQATNAAASAAAAAKTAEDSAGYASIAAQSARDAQVAQKAAEDAAEKAEADKAAAEEAKLAAEAAQAAAEKAALDGAKYQAALNLDTYAEQVDQTGFASEQIEALATIVSDAKTAISEAETLDEIQAILDAAKAEIDAIGDICPSKDYTDVTADGWYHEYVDYMIENGYMNGISETLFDVDGTVTRAQLVTILYRVAGEADVEGMANPFADVPADAWYTDAVIWAANEGVVKGVSETAFEPDTEITREQIVTILYRYDGEQAVEEDALVGYSDAASVSEYAAEAMNWAIANGIVNGVTETTLAPTDTATRAQICAIMMRYLEK